MLPEPLTGVDEVKTPAAAPATPVGDTSGIGFPVPRPAKGPRLHKGFIEARAAPPAVVARGGIEIDAAFAADAA